MTELLLTISDDLAQRAKQVDLLNNQSIAVLLEEAVYKKAGNNLRNLMTRLHQVDEPPLSDEELNAEIQATRRGN